MPKAAVKTEAPLFGSFTPFDPHAPPLVLEPEAPAPGGPVPAALAPVPNVFPAGQTYEAFLYGLITSGVDATTGVTRAYVSDTPNAASGLRGWHVDKLDKAAVTSSGLSFDVEGSVRWELGVDYDTATDGTADFVLAYDPSVLANEVQQISVGTNTGGQFKVEFNNETTADIAYNATAATVQTALRALSTIGSPNVTVSGRAGGPWLVDFVGTLAAAGQNLMNLVAGTTPLSGGTGAAITRISAGVTGADLVRWSPYSDASGTTAPKLLISAPAGTPRADTEFVLVNAPSGLSAISARYRDDAGTLNGFSITNISTANRRAVINLNNLWQIASDYQHADTENFHIVDSNASGTPIRFFLEGAASNALVPKAGVNTAAPLSQWHIGSSNDASLIDVIQTTLSAGYSTLTNRTMQWQTMVSASQSNNFFWMMGTLGASSTGVVPTATSVGPVCHGIACDQTNMSLISAPSGTNQTISRVVKIGSGTLGFFDITTPVSQQVGASAAGIASIADAPAKAAILALQNALAAYQLVTAPA